MFDISIICAHEKSRKLRAEKNVNRNLSPFHFQSFSINQMFVFFLKQVEPYYLLLIGMLLVRPILGSMRVELNTSVLFKDNHMSLIDKVKVFGVDFQVVKFIEVL